MTGIIYLFAEAIIKKRGEISVQDRKKNRREGNMEEITGNNNWDKEEQEDILNRTYEIICLNDEDDDEEKEMITNKKDTNDNEENEDKQHNKERNENQDSKGKAPNKIIQQGIQNEEDRTCDEQNNIKKDTNNDTMNYDEILEVIKHIEEEEYKKEKEKQDKENMGTTQEMNKRDILKRKHTDMNKRETRTKMQRREDGRHGNDREIEIRKREGTFGYNLNLDNNKQDMEINKAIAHTETITGNSLRIATQGSKLEESENRSIIKEIKGGFENHTGLEDLVIPENVRILLSLGEKFITPYKNYELEDIITMIKDVEEVWNESQIEGKTKNFNIWKSNIIKEMIGMNRRYSKMHREIINSLMELERFIRQNHNLQIARGDKGKKTIIMLKSHFKQMKTIFMEKAVNAGLYKWEGEVTEERIDSINTAEIEKLKRRIKIWKIKGIFREKTEYYIQMEAKLWEIANNVEGTIPKMEFLVKTHKPEGLQLRNICPKNNACTYNISVILTNVLEEALRKSWEGMQYIDMNIYNTIAFAEDLQNKTLDDSEEITIYDVKEMFNAINTEKLMNIIARHIDNKIYNRDTILNMATYDTKEANWVINDGQIYRQNGGIPMGSPTSTMYAKIFTDYFIMINWEELKRNGTKIIHKYIDDIMIIHEKECGEKIKKIMERDMGLELKMEKKEEGKEIEYLDMKIHIQQDGKINTKWNKKEYVSNRLIHSCSQIDYKIKEATLVNRIVRTTRITSGIYLYDCIQVNIEEILNNGYSTKQAKNAIKKAILKIMDIGNKNYEQKIKHLEECIKTLNFKIKQEMDKKKLENLNKMNWRRIYGKIESRKINKKTKLKGILQRKRTKGSKYIRIPHDFGNAGINRRIKGMFKGN